jgi:oligopeptide transport system permease protein
MKASDIKYISPEKFILVQQDGTIHDLKFDTKPIGYFQDAWLRFRRNKGSVVAACIIGLMLAFALFVPVFSKYDVNYKDGFYTYSLPKSEFLSKFGIVNGNSKHTYNQQSFDYYNAIPGAVVKVYESYEGAGPRNTTNTFYKITLDSYAKIGYVYKNLTKNEYEDLLAYEKETGIQVLYPMVDTKQVAPGFDSDPNYWFKHNSKGAAVYDEGGNYQDIFMKDEDSPDGYAYYTSKMGGNQYKTRVIYNEYYNYINGFYPIFLLGSDGFGQDILVRLASGARLSFILGIVVATINIIVGTMYGAIEGYYGGVLDLLMERFSEIMGAIPSIVTFSLFQMYFARKFGSVFSLLFAFVFTGWIYPAYRVRTQFYRFKGQEYVLAARTLGAKDSRLIMRHILPNALGTIITSTILMIPSVIFTESTLSYLGIVDLQTSKMTSVGTLLSNGQTALSTYPHAIFFPALYISLLMISFNLFGNGLRDAFNPSLRGSED